MPIEQYTYWSVTINNPDDNDYLIIKNPNEKYIRSMVWTPEEGEEGTKHIQGWVRFQRNQSMAFVKKLYPRAHIKPCDKDTYNENCHSYAQKDDDTTDGPHQIILNDPLPANDTLLYKVIEESFDTLSNENDTIANEFVKYQFDVAFSNKLTLSMLETNVTERMMIRDKSGLEKIFVSPAYEKMKSKYWREILYRLLKHKYDAEHSHAKETQVENRSGRDSDSDQESEASEDEGFDQSSCDETDEEDDFKDD